MLQHVACSQIETQALEVLAGSCPSLQELDLGYSWWSGYYDAVELARFPHLRSVRLLVYKMDTIQFQQVVNILKESSLKSLELLGLQGRSMSIKGVIAILNTFSNLKELDLGSVRIYARSRGGGGGGGDGSAVIDQDQDQEPCVQSLGQLYSMSTIIQNWDPSQRDRPTGDRADWWHHWNRAVTLMKAVREEYVRHHQLEAPESESSSEIRSIRMQFMYPFRAFMSRKDIQEFRRLCSGRGFTLTDTYHMAQAIERDKRSWVEGRHEGSKEEVKEESDDEWNEYGQVLEQAEPALEYSIAKSSNRHHSLNGRKRNSFQKPFKK